MSCLGVYSRYLYASLFFFFFYITWKQWLRVGFFPSLILTWTHTVWISGKCIAYIHCPIYSFRLNLATEIVSLFSEKERRVEQMAVSSCIPWVGNAEIHYLMYHCTNTSVKLYTEEGQAQAVWWKPTQVIIFYSTSLFRLIQKQNKGMSHTTSCYAKAHFNSMHWFTGNLGCPYA